MSTNSSGALYIAPIATLACAASPPVVAVLRQGKPDAATVAANPDERSFLLPVSGPAIRNSTAGQRRFALVLSVVLMAGTALLLPFATVPWPHSPAFLPTFQTAAIGICLITAALMYGHYEATRSTVLLHLSAGYAYTAGILALQFLSFPGVLVESGRLLGGPRSTSWLWAFWHIGPAASILYFAWSEHNRPNRLTPNGTRAVLATGAALIAALLATAALVTVFHDSLPILDVNGNYSGVTALSVIAIGVEIALVAALAYLWRASSFRNVLHVWLGIVAVALLCDNAVTIFAGSRLAMGWYVGRLIALMAFSVMMLVYLHEIFVSYRRSIHVAGQLALSNAQLDRDVEQGKLHAERLQEADRSKDQFLATLAHELRNPLAPISSAVHLLSAGKLDERVLKKTSEMLARQVRQMTGMVDDLLDVSRVTQGLVLHVAAVQAEQVLADAVEQVSPLIESKRQVLQVQLPDEPVLLLADHARMVQIMANLLNNAAKYTEPGGCILLRLEVREANVIFAVTDNGRGMSPELVRRAFLLFSQGELASDRSSGGLG
ncbi:MAG: MASE4 domain-containing protein, partial [Pseudomonadota bacterium]|nr:MASE4 domain-containing protein [Pseudomonadota bacterium]